MFIDTRVVRGRNICRRQPLRLANPIPRLATGIALCVVLCVVAPTVHAAQPTPIAQSTGAQTGGDCFLGICDPGVWLQDAVNRLYSSYRVLSEDAANLPLPRLQRIVPGRDHSAQEMLHGLIEHGAYHGGQIALPKMPIPGVGWLAYGKDTEGNLVGVMHSDPTAR